MPTYPDASFTQKFKIADEHRKYSYTENDIGVNAAAATMLSVTPNPFPLASKPYKNTIMYKPEVLIT